MRYLTKFCKTLVLIAALAMTLPLLGSCDDHRSTSEIQQDTQNVLKNNDRIQKFLGTCEQNGGIKQLTASGHGARGSRSLKIICNNGLSGQTDQF